MYVPTFTDCQIVSNWALVRPGNGAYQYCKIFLNTPVLGQEQDFQNTPVLDKSKISLHTGPRLKNLSKRGRTVPDMGHNRQG